MGVFILVHLNPFGLFIPAFVKDLKFTNYPDIKDPNLMSLELLIKQKSLKC